jgi:hypothetical protein
MFVHKTRSLAKFLNKLFYRNLTCYVRRKHEFDFQPTTLSFRGVEIVTAKQAVHKLHSI